MSAIRLAACAEMVFTDLPIEERVRRIADLGFEVEIWDWTTKDLALLAKTGATFSSMTGYIRGTLADAEGARELLARRSSRCGPPRSSTAPGSTSTAPASTAKACPCWRPTSSPPGCG